MGSALMMKTSVLEVFLLPPNFMYTNTGECSGSGCKVAITADKQSNVYVTDKDYLGKANLGSSCAGSTNDIECVTTPFIPPNDPAQGYWGSPAYLWYTSGGQTYNMLYYSVDAPLTVTEPGRRPRHTARRSYADQRLPTPALKQHGRPSDSHDADRQHLDAVLPVLSHALGFVQRDHRAPVGHRVGHRAEPEQR